MSQTIARRARHRRPFAGLAGNQRLADTRAPVGRDFSRARLGAARRRWPAVSLVAGVLIALAIVHVRVRLIDEGYLRAAAIERVETLQDRRQQLKAEVGSLKNHDRLSAFASERNFRKPQREAWLPVTGELRP